MRLPQLRTALHLAAVALVPAVLASCGSDRILSPSGASAVTDVNVEDPSVTFIIPPATYNGQVVTQGALPTGINVFGSNLCNLSLILQRVDNGQLTASWGSCNGGPQTFGAQVPGDYNIVLRYFDAGTFAQHLAVVGSVSATKGQTVTATAPELGAKLGLVTGAITVNGAAPANNAYRVCPAATANACAFVTNGSFTAFVPEGAGSLTIVTQTNVVLATFTYTAAAGQTVDQYVDEDDQAFSHDLAVTDPSVTFIIPPAAYNGQVVTQGALPTGINVFGSNLCNLSLILQRVDNGQLTASWGSCNGGPQTFAGQTPGDYNIVLRHFDAGTFAQHLVVVGSVSAAKGQTVTAAAPELGAKLGLLTGAITVNGAAPANNAYRVCPAATANACAFVTNGSFTAFVPEGAGSLTIVTQTNVVLATFTYTATAGHTVDTFTDGNGQRFSHDLTVRDDGATIIVPPAKYNGQVVTQGVLPTGMNVFGSNLCNLSLILQRVDNGQLTASWGSCNGGPQTFAGQTPGDYNIVLRHFDAGTFAQHLAVVGGVSVTAGQTVTATAPELGTKFGLLAGDLKVNGAVPANNSYRVCPTATANACAFVTGGKFTAFVPAGPGEFTVVNQANTVLGTFTFIAAAGQTVTAGQIAGGTPGETPSGTDVTVQPVNNGSSTSNTSVSLTFGNVTSGGTTTVTQTNKSNPVPDGLRLGNPPIFYDIVTTASFSGPIEVCINYTGTTFENQKKLQLLHGNNDGTWTNVTTSLDLVNRIICGRVSSLSPFVVVEDVAPPAVKPTLSATVTGTKGTGGWYKSDVTVHWNVDDHGSAVTSSDGCGDQVITTNTAGMTFTCTATNAGGTSSESVTIGRDASQPTVTAAVSGEAGVEDWYVGDVTIAWSVVPNGPSGASADCPGVSLTTDTRGTTYTCAATSGAGVGASGSSMVKRDATRPTIAFSGAAASYTVDQTVSIGCDATDATSGIAASTCGPMQKSAFAFNVGPNAIEATASDHAGNTTSARVEFMVQVTAPSLSNLVTRFVSDIKSQRLLLNRIALMSTVGNAQAKSEQVKNFLKELEASRQNGEVSDADAAVLAKLVRLL